MSDAHPEWFEPPHAPSREDWRRLRSSRGSLMRELMNLEIEAETPSGKVLDVGGGAASSYAELLRVTDLTSVNVDPEIRPTVVADLAAHLPFANDSFDSVLSFNTLEHLADDRFALAEMVRVLRPGGTLWLLVPFLYRVHGHPEDYHRHTAAGWNHLLCAAGLPSDHQRIRPLVWDPMSTAWAIADVAPIGRNWWRARRFLRPLVLRRPLAMRPVDRRLDDDTWAVVSDYALAYSVRATKPLTGT